MGWGADSVSLALAPVLASCWRLAIAPTLRHMGRKMFSFTHIQGKFCCEPCAGAGFPCPRVLLPGTGSGLWGISVFPGSFGVSREFWRFQGVLAFPGNFGVSREFWCFRGMLVFPHCSWVGKAALGGAGAALRVLWRLKRELFTICSWAGMLNIGRGCRDSGCPEGVRNAWMWHSGLGTGWDQLLRVTLRFFPSPVIWDSCFKGAAPPVCSFLLGVCPGQG